jgi:hypothetical protein
VVGHLQRDGIKHLEGGIVRGEAGDAVRHAVRMDVKEIDDKGELIDDFTIIKGK